MTPPTSLRDPQNELLYKMADLLDKFYELNGRDATESEENYMFLNLIRHILGKAPISSITNGRNKIGMKYNKRKARA